MPQLLICLPIPSISQKMFAMSQQAVSIASIQKLSLLKQSFRTKRCCIWVNQGIANDITVGRTIFRK
jgi:hypothetical protein